MLTDKNNNPSVQDIIDQLSQVEDRSVPFEINMWDEDFCNLDYKEIQIDELLGTSGKPSCVSLDVTFTAPVRQIWPHETELDEDDGPTPYEEKHRPQNQILVEGVPVNPLLRDGFDATHNDDRDDREISDWWDRPFIRAYTWFDMAIPYSVYLERIEGIEGVEAKTREQHIQEQNDYRAQWFDSWPCGIRYDVRCLDGGAWDRSTNWAQVGDFKEALEIAKTGKYFQE